MYVLDTNTVIHFFIGKGNVSKRLLAIPPSEIGLPAIVVYELFVGVARSRSPEERRIQLIEFLGAVRILPFSYAEAQAAANIRIELEQKGAVIGPYDTLIAATAVAGRQILVTHNTEEFKRIASLQIQDWYA